MPTSLTNLYCNVTAGNFSIDDTACDPYYAENNLTSSPAIPGLGSSVHIGKL